MSCRMKPFHYFYKPVCSTYIQRKKPNQKGVIHFSKHLLYFFFIWFIEFMLLLQPTVLMLFYTLETNDTLTALFWVRADLVTKFLPLPWIISDTVDPVGDKHTRCSRVSFIFIMVSITGTSTCGSVIKLIMCICAGEFLRRPSAVSRVSCVCKLDRQLHCAAGGESVCHW